MNAIIGLCHFCEAHGPCSLFCTFTTDNEKDATEASKSSVQCSGCTSLGPETVFVSRNDDGTLFCSRESVPNAEVTTFLRQSAIRSITCEVNWSKEGGVVYFNDTHGHVLSFTFQLHDTWARGLKRWFSIVVLMKDKMQLLNITPLLSEHMQKISKELQELAEAVFDAEQKVCSQRALRLKTGRNDFVQSRSLMHLTGDDNVFKRLHTHFTWMLKAGAQTYSETLHTSHDLLKKLNPKIVKNSIFDSAICNVNGDNESISLRQLECLVAKEIFRILLYCVLTGIHIVVKSSNIKSATIVSCLSRLLPVNFTNNRIRENNDEEQLPPLVLFLEETENNIFCYKWSGTLPIKCPTLMNRIENSISNDKITDQVLHEHIHSLLLEWLGIAKALKAAVDASGPRSDAVTKLKQVFGVAQHDEVLLNFWINVFCK